MNNSNAKELFDLMNKEYTHINNKIDNHSMHEEMYLNWFVSLKLNDPNMKM